MANQEHQEDAQSHGPPVQFLDALESFCPRKWRQGRSRVKGSIFRVRRVELSAVLMDGPQQDKERKPGKKCDIGRIPVGDRVDQAEVKDNQGHEGGEGNQRLEPEESVLTQGYGQFAAEPKARKNHVAHPEGQPEENDRHCWIHRAPGSVWASVRDRPKRLPRIRQNPTTQHYSRITTGRVQQQNKNKRSPKSPGRPVGEQKKRPASRQTMFL